jgi:hypothetical protein
MELVTQLILEIELREIDGEVITHIVDVPGDCLQPRFSTLRREVMPKTRVPADVDEFLIQGGESGHNYRLLCPRLQGCPICSRHARVELYLDGYMW